MKKIPYDFIWQRLATILVAIVTLSLIATITGILLSFTMNRQQAGLTRH